MAKLQLLKFIVDKFEGEAQRSTVQLLLGAVPELKDSIEQHFGDNPEYFHCFDFSETLLKEKLIKYILSLQNEQDLISVVKFFHPFDSSKKTFCMPRLSNLTEGILSVKELQYISIQDIKSVSNLNEFIIFLIDLRK